MFMPCRESFDKTENLTNLIKSANTQLIHQIKRDEDPTAFLKNIDYQLLGFQKPKHYKIEKKPEPHTDLINIYIKPVHNYDLRDFIDIPPVCQPEIQLLY